MIKIVLKTAWWKWGGDGVGWVVDEDETELPLEEYDGSDGQQIEIIIEKAKIRYTDGHEEEISSVANESTGKR